MRTLLDSAADGSGGGRARGARVFTVPAGRPFLQAVAAAILNGDLPATGGRAPNPLELPDITLLLPTRRATRAMQDAFLTASGGRAMTLPQIRPISAGDEELTLLSGLASPGTLGTDALDLPPAVSEIERRLVLTMLVQRWSQTIRRDTGDAAHLGEHAAAAGANTPAQAAHLAAELARLMDMVETENVPLDGLAALVPDEYSEHWKRTLEFLEIITAFWPAYLAEKKLLSPAARRNQAILAEAKRLSDAPPSGPVIVAGVTGSVPATVELMAAVARLPQGAIVLPGLDLHLDAESWTAIAEHPEHPQFGFAKLLAALGVERADVQQLRGADLSAAGEVRDGLVGEAMRPSGMTGRWQQYIAAADAKAVRAALAGVSLIEAPSAQDEAETVALILREAAETPGRTAALVSPDRLLARRVAVRLETWGIRVDDSAGRPFAKTPPGTFLDLAISAAADDFAPAAVMALLKHPLTRLGLDAFAVRRAGRALEIAAFRDVYLGRGIDGIAEALARAEEAVTGGRRRHRAVGRLWPDDWRGAEDLVARLQAAFAPLLSVFATKSEQPLQAIAQAHVAVAEALCALPEAEQTDAGLPLWQGEAGTAATTFFSGLIDPQLPPLQIAAGDYADLYRSLIVGENVRPRVAVHPRLVHLGAVRSTPAADRRHHPRLAQRRHVARGRRSRPVAQPADAQGAGPAFAGAGDRLRRARLHLAARRRTRLHHPRREDRRRADRPVALADAPAGAARRHGVERCVAARSAVARLGPHARPRATAAAHPRARAASRIGAAAAQNERHAHRSLAEEPLRDLRPRHPQAREAADARRRSRRGAARQRHPRHHEPLRPALRRPAAGRCARRADGHRARGPRRLRQPRARRRLLAAALSTLRAMVRRDRAGAPRWGRARLRRDRRQPHHSGAGRTVQSHGARRPHRSYEAAASSSPTTRPAARPRPSTLPTG